jgi:choline-glycine betaine transporter
MEESKKYRLYTAVFIPAIIILTVEILFGMFFTDKFGTVLNNIIYWVGDNFGWWINILSVLAIIFAICLVIFKYGDVRIGGADAKPEYTTWQWISITICGGVGVGLLFWAMGEPIYHFMTPPVAAGVEAGSREAAIFAVSQAMFNWSFVQYAMYALCGLAFALLTYNSKKSLSFGSLVEHSFNRKIFWLTTVVQVFAVYALASGVSNSMGAGLLQIGAGVESVFHIAQGNVVWLLIAVFVGAFFIISCVTGISKGLTNISSVTMILFFFLLGYVLIFGDARFISKISTEAVGNIMDNFWSKITYNNTMVPKDQWANEWTITYWNAFIIFAPVIGMFLARLGKGRTVRQFLLFNIFVPSIFCVIWVGVFAGMIMKVQSSGLVDVWAAVQEFGMQTAIYQVLGDMPGGTFIQMFFLVAVILSFVTLADPMSSVLATLCVRDQQIDDEPPTRIKILMGIIVTTVSYLLVASGGSDSVKGLLNLGGLLMTLPMLWLFLENFRISGNLLKKKNYLSDTDKGINSALKKQEVREINAALEKEMAE